MKDFETVILLFSSLINFWLFNWFKPYVIFLRKLQSHFRPFSFEWREEGWRWFFPLLNHVSVFVIFDRLCDYLQIVFVVCLLGKLDELIMAHSLTCYRLEKHAPRVLLLLFPVVIFLYSLDMDADRAVGGSWLAGWLSLGPVFLPLILKISITHGILLATVNITLL